MNVHTVASYSMDKEGFSAACAHFVSSGVAAENYLANLALYPGRFELLFLPSNTQVKKKA